ncbi:MAG: hypothetical protein NCW75_06770 [Phycisphaera sp.]|nr:MAG: hypothetical protein NCW75_06770 [Phycisphaera sp.]
MPDPKRFPTVLLRHDLPGGSHHFDWMLALDDHGSLLTFRLDRDISLDAEPFEAEQLAGHRRAYLEYEGEVSGNRGTVVRVASGHCDIHARTDHSIELSLHLGVRHENLGGIRQKNGRFLFGSR